MAVTVHNKTHEGRNNYKYGLCDKFYSKVSNLKIHVKGVHEKLGKQKCESWENHFKKTFWVDIFLMFMKDKKINVPFVESHFFIWRFIFLKFIMVKNKTTNVIGVIKHVSHLILLRNDRQKCKSCGKYFTQSTNLNIHIKMIHENN